MDPVADLMLAAANSAPLSLLVRYEGVLVPQRPEGPSAPDVALLSLLRRVTKRPHTTLHLITAASAAGAAGWFDGTGVTVHAADGHPLAMPALLATVRAVQPEAQCVVIGTTSVDEDLFLLVRAPDVTARVGSGATAAEARLEDTDTVRGLLGALC